MPSSRRRRRRRFLSNFKWPEDPLNLVEIKNPFGSFQTNPKADAWWVPPIFFLKKLFLWNTLQSMHSYNRESTRTSKDECLTRRCKDIATGHRPPAGGCKHFAGSCERLKRLQRGSCQTPEMISTSFQPEICVWWIRAGFSPAFERVKKGNFKRSCIAELWRPPLTLTLENKPEMSLEKVRWEHFQLFYVALYWKVDIIKISKFESA